MLKVVPKLGVTFGDAKKTWSSLLRVSKIRQAAQLVRTRGLVDASREQHGNAATRALAELVMLEVQEQVEDGLGLPLDNLGLLYNAFDSAPRDFHSSVRLAPRDHLERGVEEGDHVIELLVFQAQLAVDGIELGEDTLDQDFIMQLQ